MSDELLEGEERLPISDQDVVMTDREWAAEKIATVAEGCAIGVYPDLVSPFDLGRALGRALSNYEGTESHSEVIRGLMHYASRRLA